MKSSTLSCSGRRSKTGSRRNAASWSSDQFSRWALARARGLRGVAHHLAALAESRLDDGLEEGLVAAEGLAAVPAQPDDGGLDLGRRGETAGADGEEIFDVIPGLQQD